MDQKALTKTMVNVAVGSSKGNMVDFTKSLSKVMGHVAEVLRDVRGGCG